MGIHWYIAKLLRHLATPVSIRLTNSAAPYTLPPFQRVVKLLCAQRCYWTSSQHYTIAALLIFDREIAYREQRYTYRTGNENNYNAGPLPAPFPWELPSGSGMTHVLAPVQAQPSTSYCGGGSCGQALELEPRLELLLRPLLLLGQVGARATGLE